MATYVILTQIDHDAFLPPRDFKAIAERVSAEVKRQCPNVRWKDSYATLGHFDAVDIIESDDPLAVERAVLIIRGYGHATTQTLPATPWHEFVARLQ